MARNCSRRRGTRNSSTRRRWSARSSRVLIKDGMENILREAKGDIACSTLFSLDADHSARAKRSRSTSKSAKTAAPSTFAKRGEIQTYMKTRNGERVMKSLTRFIIAKLQLKV